jgi:hypothetical protein
VPAGFSMPLSDDIAGGILHEQIEIVGMVVRPSLRFDFALIGLRRDRQKRDEEQESDDSQRLEQDDAERIERSSRGQRPKSSNIVALQKPAMQALDMLPGSV